MNGSGRRTSGAGAERVVTALALGAGLWACVAANHPVPGFDRLHERAGGLDVWLPRWRFFAPEPRSWDLVLRYRLAPGPEVWRDLPVAPDAGVTALLVNPGRRRSKALSEVGRTVARRSVSRGRDAVRDDWHHRLLVAFVLHELHRRGADRGAASVRFALVDDPGHDPGRRARLLYESDEVPIPSDPEGRAPRR